VGFPNYQGISTKVETAEEIMEVCKICGKVIEEYDSVKLNHGFGYLSKKDGSVLEFVACTKCWDRITDIIADMCIYNPVRNVEDEYNRKVTLLLQDNKVQIVDN
jgi:hypothetical protein